MHIALVSPFVTVKTNLLSNSCLLPLRVELDLLLSKKQTKANPNQTPKQKSFEDRSWSPFCDLPYYFIQLLPLTVPLLSHPRHLVPVNLHCEESPAWGYMDHLGINYERRTNILWMKSVYLSTQCIFQTTEEQFTGSGGGYRTKRSWLLVGQFMAVLGREAGLWKARPVPA